MVEGPQEIEVKYRLFDLEGLEQSLITLGDRLSEPEQQDDQAFAKDGWTYGQSKIGVSFARLRTQAGRHLFTVKQPVANELACIEHETEIGDREEMENAIKLMGFHPTVKIVKTRRTAKLGELSLCVDQVENAGLFLEIERVVSPGQASEHVQQELDAFARTLGVELERTTETYDSIVHSATV